MRDMIPRQEIIEPDVIKAAEFIMRSWTQGVEQIIETGRRLIKVRERFKDDRGKWSRLIGDNQHQGSGLLPFGSRHVYRLISIAESDRLLTHVSVMPSDSLTLYQLAQLSDDRFTALLEDGSISPSMKRSDASAETRRERQQQDEARILGLTPVEGKFKTLVIDPPWDYEWLSLAGRAKPGYATMTHDELLDMEEMVKGWTDDHHCHLYLWTTNNFMTRAVELMQVWGFQHKTVLTWVKPRWGLGSYFRNTTEHVLFGTTGDINTRTTDIATHFEAPMGEHSEKPDEFYDIVTRASYPPYGEVFQRNERDQFPNLFT